MFKRFKRWYADTPKQVRICWLYVLGSAIGIPRFLWMLGTGADIESAMLKGLLLYTFVPILPVAVPMILADLKGEKFTVWPVMDEMERQINVRARAVTAVVFYLYFGVSMVATMAAAHAKGMDTIPVSVLESLVQGACFVWMFSLSISTVLIYYRQDSKVKVVSSSSPGEAKQ